MKNSIKTILRIGMFLIFSVILACPMAYAKQYTIESDGSYRVGDGLEENHSVAKQRAREEALRRASLEAGLYLESYSEESKGFLTRDEINMLSATVLQVKSEKISPQVISDSIVQYNCHVVAVVDTDNINEKLLGDKMELAKAVQRNKETENENLRLRRELQELKDQFENTKSDHERQELRDRAKMNDREFQAVQFFQEAERLYNRGRDMECIPIYQKAIEYNPNLLDAYCRLAYIYLYTVKDRNKAREMVDKGIAVAKKTYLDMEIDYLVNDTWYVKDVQIVGTIYPIYDLYECKTVLEGGQLEIRTEEQVSDGGRHVMIRTRVKTDW